MTADENLQNATNPMAMFELPQLNGGYLEYCRAIVADIIAKMSALGLNESAATTMMLQGDGYYSAGSFKAAFKTYQKAYGLAAN